MENARQYLDDSLDSELSNAGIENVDFLLKIFKELLKGKAVSKKVFSSIAELPPEKEQFLLENLAEQDEKGDVIAFSGMSLTPTNHSITINDKKLYTWCAIDAILFTDWLNINSRIQSRDPVDNSFIELQLVGDHLQWTKPYPIFVSLVEGLNTCDIRNSFCNHVSFFASEATAKKWLEQNPHGKIISIDDFFETSKTGLSCC